MYAATIQMWQSCFSFVLGLRQYVYVVLVLNPYVYVFIYTDISIQNSLVSSAFTLKHHYTHCGLPFIMQKMLSITYYHFFTEAL